MRGEVVERDAQDKPLVAVYRDTPEDETQLAETIARQEERGREVVASLAEELTEKTAPEGSATGTEQSTPRTPA